MPDVLNEILQGLGGRGTYAVLGLLLVAAVGMLAAAGYSIYNPGKTGVSKRLKAVTGIRKKMERKRERDVSIQQRMIGGISRLAAPKTHEDLKNLNKLMAHAGYRDKKALSIYQTMRVVLAFVFPVLFLMVNQLRPEPFPMASILALIMAALGFYAPSLFLRVKISQRQEKIRFSLPDAFDMLLICVEAGLGMDAALKKVSDEVKISSPELHDELKLVTNEIHAGVQRSTALHNMAERTGVEEMSTMVAILVQTEKFGTSLAQSLRVQADAMRNKRKQEAEERAAKSPVKLTVPLILFILPALFVVIVGPAIIRIIRVLMPMFGGQ